MSTRPHFRQSSPRLEKKGGERTIGVEAALKPYLVHTRRSRKDLLPREQRARKGTKTS